MTFDDQWIKRALHTRRCGASRQQPYRDRADAQNAFDELKNQWGLGGFTTQDINRCQTVARVCALAYNRWSWYCRAAHPTGRLEAITSRPLLLAAVGKAASHANQTTLCLTPLHGRADMLRKLIGNIGAALRHVKAIPDWLGRVAVHHLAEHRHRALPRSRRERADPDRRFGCLDVPGQATAQPF